MIIVVVLTLVTHFPCASTPSDIDRLSISFYEYNISLNTDSDKLTLGLSVIEATALLFHRYYKIVGLPLGKYPIATGTSC